jgi:uncharacterized protein YktB (UPF0637 family)
MGYRSKSMLTVPMRHDKGEVIGVIQLINAMNAQGEVIPFSDEATELMMSIASQAAVALRNARLISDIKNLFAAFVKYSATAIDERSPHTADHTRRVAGMSMRIARAINQISEGPLAEVHFNDQQLEELWFSAWLHDIGKIAVKETVLEKSTRLTDERLGWILTRLQNNFGNYKIDHLKVSNYDEKALSDQAIKDEEQRLLCEVEFLKKLNLAGFLSDEDEARLKTLSTQKYADLYGNTLPLIDDF